MIGKRRMRAAAVMAVCFTCGSAAQAQVASQPPPVSAPDLSTSAVVQELLVIGRRPGPALFTVRRGGSSVVILGGVTPLPHMLVWDTARVERALDGATVLLTPPRGRPGVMDMLSIVFHAGDVRLPRGQTLDGLMNPSEQARFETLRRQAKTDPKRYQSLKPAAAGFLLRSDFRRAAGLSDAKPASTMVRLAEAHHVPVKTVGEFRLAQLFRAIKRMTPEQDRACLDAALSDTEREAQHAAETAQAWANGDLRAVRASYHGDLLDECILATPSLQAALDRGIAEGVTAVDAALSRPGKTVVVIDLNFLLQPNGLLDQLRAKGDAVSTPPD